MLHRTYPCCCDACMDENYEECENAEYVGNFNYYKMNPKGIRVPKARYPGSSGRNVTSDGRNFVVEAIVANRVFEGVYQYEIKWQGYEVWISKSFVH